MSRKAIDKIVEIMPCVKVELTLPCERNYLIRKLPPALNRKPEKLVSRGTLQKNRRGIFNIDTWNINNNYIKIVAVLSLKSGLFFSCFIPLTFGFGDIIIHWPKIE